MDNEHISKIENLKKKVTLDVVAAQSFCGVPRRCGGHGRAKSANYHAMHEKSETIVVFVIIFIIITTIIRTTIIRPALAPLECVCGGRCTDRNKFSL